MLNESYGNLFYTFVLWEQKENEENHVPELVFFKIHSSQQTAKAPPIFHKLHIFWSTSSPKLPMCTPNVQFCSDWSKQRHYKRWQTQWTKYEEGNNDRSLLADVVPGNILDQYIYLFWNDLSLFRNVSQIHWVFHFVPYVKWIELDCELNYANCCRLLSLWIFWGVDEYFCIY